MFFTGVAVYLHIGDATGMAMSGDAFLSQTTLARPTARELWTCACPALEGRDGPHPGNRLAMSSTERHAAAVAFVEPENALCPENI